MRKTKFSGCVIKGECQYKNGNLCNGFYIDDDGYEYLPNDGLCVIYEKERDNSRLKNQTTL